jgi:hypothetical protein
MNSRIHHAAAVALVVLFSGAVKAATYIVPEDRTLITSAEQIVVGTVIDTYSRRADRGLIETVAEISIEEKIKGGDGSGTIQITQWGGHIGNDWLIQSGAPSYHLGDRLLLFLRKNRRGDWTTFGLGLGSFRFVRGRDGTSLLQRHGETYGWIEDGSMHTERPRLDRAFLEYVRAVVRGGESVASYFAPEPHFATERPIIPNATFTSASYTDRFGSNPMRRTGSGLSVDWRLAGTQGSLDLPEAVDFANSEWNDQSPEIDYARSASPASGDTKANDSEHRVIANDPHGDVDGDCCPGIVAVAFQFCSGLACSPYVFNGDTFLPVTHSDVVVNDVDGSTLSQNVLELTMVHEFGHTLGLRHSNTTHDDAPCSAPLDCCINTVAGGSCKAIMNSSVISTLNGLAAWDRRAVDCLYDGDCSESTSCTTPSIVTQPQNKSISLGSSTSLSVTASGTAPLSYQWFIGNSGDTSTPTGSNSSALNNLSPTTTTSYWVRITNSCPGSVDSNTATVTVTCTNAAITTHPANKTITEGQSTTLSVSATGSNRSYQWYEGSSGDTSNPIGTNSSSITVSPNETTNYWVRVSAACGPPADSNTATVTVNECASLTIGSPTATPGASAGQFTLSITASSTSTPLEFEWFRGETPGFGGTKVASTQSFATTVFAVTSFWARVTNACDRVKVSSLITVAPCTLPAITTQPEDKTVTSGGTTTLSIAFTGIGNVNWYRGTVGDKSALVGTGTSVTVGPLTQTTLFWAEVSNGCGPVASRQVTVTVEPLTETLLMLNERFTVVVNYINQFENPPTTGRLKGRSLSNTTLSDTAIFTFGDPNVIELMVRLSDARPFDNHIHVFYGGLSDIEFFISVTDSLTGVATEYHKPANQLIGQVDRTTFVAVPGASLLQSGIDALMAETANRAIRPFEDSDTIMMLNGRYQVRMRYRNQFVNPPTEGYLLARSIASTTMTETAVFFGDPSSVEWMVRFSDARPFDNHIHFYHGGLTDLELTVEVTDTLTGLHKEYAKPGNTLVGAVDRLSWLP